MHVPDLPPDLRFPSLPQDEEAFRYSFEVKRAAMGPYIVAHWGWDEALQLRLHGERFGEFYLLPAYQRRGIGSGIIEHCLALADAQGSPVRLEYLKWNPVGALYRRHGFVTIGETEIHWLMERPAAKRATS
jgi:GNAT superfamily N-acetyltransferase